MRPSPVDPTLRSDVMSQIDPARARGILADLDARIDATPRRRDERPAARVNAACADEARADEARATRATLGTDRDAATPLVTLYDELGGALPDAPRVAFGLALRRIAESMLEAFPDNIFWDLDALAAQLAAGAREHGPAWVTAESALVASLQHLFGGGTVIRFRYVHDFLYGFDWAKWVRRDPEARARVGPFDPRFVRVMWQRGHELLALIARDDAKYPRLRGEAARNPFGFRREPDDERRLFRDLAAHDLLPVRAWQRAPRTSFAEPFRERREERARALGLPTP